MDRTAEFREFREAAAVLQRVKYLDGGGGGDGGVMEHHQRPLEYHRHRNNKLKVKGKGKGIGMLKGGVAGSTEDPKRRLEEEDRDLMADFEAYEEFMLVAKDLHRDLQVLDDRLKRGYATFVGSHRYLPTGAATAVSTNNHDDYNSMNYSGSDGEGDDDVSSATLSEFVDGCLEKFMKGIVGIRRLVKHQNRDITSGQALLVTGVQRKLFCNNVEKYLMQCSQDSARLYEKMKRNRSKLNVNPYRIITSNLRRNDNQSNLKLKFDIQNGFSASLASSSASASPSLSEAASSSSGNDDDSDSSLGIVEKYEKQAIPTERLRDYKRHINTYKENKSRLMEGAQHLLEQDQDDLNEVAPIEQAVVDTVQLFTQFSLYLNDQSEVVEDLYDNSLTTLATQKETETQLIQTNERTKGSQNNILIFASGLAFLLLLLDFLTP